MAEEEKELDDKTEEATPQRREEWKKEGRVAQSKDLTAALVLLFVTVSIYIFSQWSLKGVSYVFEGSFNEIARLGSQDWSIATVMQMAGFLVSSVIKIVMPVIFAVVVVALLASVSQIGFIWTTKPLEPKLERLNPIAGVKRIFSIEGLFEFAKAILKFVIVATVTYMLLRSWLSGAATLADANTQQLSIFIGYRLLWIIVAASLAMFLLSSVDYAFKKFRHEMKIKMTKQEHKEDRKRTEGNPQTKARIRAIQQQVSQRRMVEAVKKADVVVTNPTHIAVALVYDREQMMAPRVVAKGADFLAEQIKKIARENGVPCVENVPLARALYKALKIGQFISRDLYNAVAEVLAYVYRLRGREL